MLMPRSANAATAPFSGNAGSGDKSPSSLLTWGLMKLVLYSAVLGSLGSAVTKVGFGGAPFRYLLPLFCGPSPLLAWISHKVGVECSQVQYH